MCALSDIVRVLHPCIIYLEQKPRLDSQLFPSGALSDIQFPSDNGRSNNKY